LKAPDTAAAANSKGEDQGGGKDKQKPSHQGGKGMSDMGDLLDDGFEFELAQDEQDGGGEASAPGQGASSPNNPWFIRVAQAIAKVSNQLQKELMASLLLKHFVEWCVTPDPRQKGVAFQDC
jgi:hypothetical protein